SSQTTASWTTSRRQNRLTGPFCRSLKSRRFHITGPPRRRGPPVHASRLRGRQALGMATQVGVGWTEGIDRYFGITARGSTVETEVRGGVATFFTMAYIVVLNPLILASAKDVSGHHLSLAEVTTATALVAAAMTMLMGAVGR